MANDFDSLCIHVLVIVQADNGLQFDAAQARLNGLFDGVESGLVDRRLCKGLNTLMIVEVGE